MIEKNEDLEFTGERFVPGKALGQIEQEHLQRYYAVKEIVRGKKVLDAACGAGYGSAIMAEVANSVIGIDISAEAIAYDKNKYADIENLQYIEASITELPFEDKSLDVIVSFETIEHVDEESQQQFLKEIKRCLKEDGVLVMSSPDKANYSDESWMPGYKNPYHVKEFYFEEFKAFLQQEFSCCKYYLQGEQYIIAEMIHPCESEGNFPVQMIKSQYLARENDVYIIAVCSNRNLLASETVCSMYCKDVYVPVAFPYQDGTYRGECIMLPDLGEGEKDGTINSYRFSLIGKVIEGRLRFDPIEGKCCVFELCGIKTDVKNCIIAPINAYKCNLTEYTFLTSDPQIEIIGDFQGANYIELSYKLKILTEAEIVKSYEEILADMKTVRSMAQVFIDTGKGFNEEEKMTIPIVIDGKKIVFDVDLSNHGKIVGLRVDVCKGYYVFCQDINCSTDKGSLGIRWHNADYVNPEGVYCFYNSDPQIVFDSDLEGSRILHIEYRLEEISKDFWAAERKGVWVRYEAALEKIQQVIKMLS